MSHEDLLLLLIGSFLPNNVLLWILKKLFHPKPKPLTPAHRTGLLRKTFSAIKQDYHQFEVDPHTQLKYHRKMIIFWMCNWIPMNVLVGVDIWSILTNRGPVSLLMTAILLAVNTNYSLYANWSTEVGDAHGSYASIKAEEIQMAQSGNTDVPLVEWRL